jgi:hypothetical protein
VIEAINGRRITSSCRDEPVPSPETIKRSTGNLSSEGRTPARQSGSLAAEIALDQLRVNDQVLIRTRHGAYTFLVIDPAKHLGLVVGGLFGDYAAEAFLEVTPNTRDQRLRAGLRVCFYVRSSLGRRSVITSAVTELIHRRAGTESKEKP